jgi:hypothetical protein
VSFVCLALFAVFFHGSILPHPRLGVSGQLRTNPAKMSHRSKLAFTGYLEKVESFSPGLPALSHVRAELPRVRKPTFP